jgi:hypothetical protein
MGDRRTGGCELVWQRHGAGALRALSDRGAVDSRTDRALLQRRAKASSVPPVTVVVPSLSACVSLPPCFGWLR